MFPTRFVVVRKNDNARALKKTREFGSPFTCAACVRGGSDANLAQVLYILFALNDGDLLAVCYGLYCVGKVVGKGCKRLACASEIPVLWSHPALQLTARQ